MTQSIPQVSFNLHSGNTEQFGPRTGIAFFKRRDIDSGRETTIDLPTPGLICTTTRGVIQHLSSDNAHKTSVAKWIHVPFESFLQIDPPIPTLQKGVKPLHDFLGLSPSCNILSMSLRDPADGRVMPANGNTFIRAESSRGARKVTMHDYRSYATTVLPDIIFPLSDIPFTPPPYSQKRVTKSLERSLCYLLDILKPVEMNNVSYRPNVFVPMVGGINEIARSTFAKALLGELEPKEKEQTLLSTLDAGISGYVFDLVPLRQSLHVEMNPTATITPIYRPMFTELFSPLLKASLQSLSSDKPRIVNTALSPHEILLLIRDIGVDFFDSFWVQQAANWGIALDFKFPAPSLGVNPEKRQIGHNLYDAKFSNDFSKLSDEFLDGLSYSRRQKQQLSEKKEDTLDVCFCLACSPTWSNKPLRHSVAELPDPDTNPEPELAPPYTRAYIHHLLHTHEMSAHSLLVMHNITILDAFLKNVRNFLEYREPTDGFAFSNEIRRFDETYDPGLQILDEAKVSWTAVNLARGKGRLAREREAVKQAEILLQPVRESTFMKRLFPI